MLQILAYKDTQICVGWKAFVTFLGSPWSSCSLQGKLTVSQPYVHAVFTRIRLELYGLWKLTKFPITAEITDVEIEMFFSNLEESLTWFQYLKWMQKEKLDNAVQRT